MDLYKKHTRNILVITLLFLSLFIVAATVYDNTCVGLIVGSSNEDGGTDKYKLATVLPVFGALPGLQCRWHSFAEPRALSEDYINQINFGMDHLEDDVDVLIIGNTYEVLEGNVDQVLSNISSVWYRVKDIPYILFIEFPYRNGDSEENIEKYNQVINEWAKEIPNVYTVKYPMYIVDEDGMHATEKCLFALGAEIYSTLVQHGW